LATKTKVDLSAFAIKKIREEVIEIAHLTLLPILENAIINKSILKGLSPVKGQGKFEKYSPNYKKASRVVNLKVTGKLLDSFTIEPIKGGFKIGFDSDLADIHNRLGVPRKDKENVVRRMLPDETVGETFNRRITKEIEKELVRIINIVTNKMSKSERSKN